MRRSLLRLVTVFAVVLSVGAASIVIDTVRGVPAHAAKRNKKKIRKQLLKSFGTGGLSKLPSVVNALAGNARHRGRLVTKGDVTGTPPELATFASGPIKDVFWRPGVVDRLAAGSPTGDDCSEFYSSSVDGKSGGLGACHMAEAVGMGVGALLEGEGTLCHMKAFPTAALVESGGVTLDLGTLPGDDITQLFTPPAGQDPRTIRVTIQGGGDNQGPGAQTIFIQVAGVGRNQADGYVYRATLWFCEGAPDDAPAAVNRLEISASGKYAASETRAESPTRLRSSLFEGYVTGNGLDVTWDTTRPRTMQALSSYEGQSDKTSIEIGSNNRITVRTVRSNPSGQPERLFAITQFSGSNAAATRFLTGAFKDAHGSGGTNTGATEYRDSYYAAAPNAALMAQATAADLDDPFYQAPASVTLDTTGLSCSATADIGVVLDFANESLRQAISPCEDSPLRHMHFCHEDPEVSAADEHFGGACNH